MANVHLDYEVIGQKAQMLTTREDQIKTDLRSLQTEIQNMLDHDFTTEVSSGAFGERFNEFKTNADATISSMTELSNQLHQIVSNFQQLDQSGR